MNIFISHAQKDGAYAASLGRALADAGFQVWQPSDVQPGANWSLASGKALAGADAVVVLLTPDGVASESVRREIEFAISALRLKGRLVPVLVRRTSSVPWILRELPQWIEAGDPGVAARKIIGMLKPEKTPTRVKVG